MSGYLESQNPAGVYIPIAGATTVTGLKTFSVLPQSVAVPANNADLVNKAYSDIYPVLTYLSVPFNPPATPVVENTTITIFGSYIVPVGTWQISGTIGISSNNPNQGTIQAQEVNITYNASAIYDVANGAYYHTSNVPVSGIFVSDGVSALSCQTIAIFVAGTPNTATYSADANGIYSFLNLLRIA